eukprot:4806981-Amphidinium_carterae.1
MRFTLGNLLDPIHPTLCPNALLPPSDFSVYNKLQEMTALSHVSDNRLEVSGMRKRRQASWQLENPSPVQLCALADVKPGSKATIAVQVVDVRGLQMKVVDSIGGSGTVRLSAQTALHGFSVGDTRCLHRVYVDKQRKLTLYEQGGVERMSVADFKAIRRA